MPFKEVPRDYESKKKACLHHVKEINSRKRKLRSYKETTSSNHFAPNFTSVKPYLRSEERFNFTASALGDSNKRNKIAVNETVIAVTCIAAAETSVSLYKTLSVRN